MIGIDFILLEHFRNPIESQDRPYFLGLGAAFILTFKGRQRMKVLFLFSIKYSFH